jgi:hypothetical protein
MAQKKNRLEQAGLARGVFSYDQVKTLPPLQLKTLEAPKIRRG